MLALNIKRKITGFLCLFCISAHALAVALTPADLPMWGRADNTDGWTREVTAEMRNNDSVLLQKIPDEWRGKGIGQMRLLFHDYAEVHVKNYVPRDQDNAPSCVGQSVAAEV